MKTKIGIKVAHVTRDSDTTFKVTRSKVKVTRGRGHIVAAFRLHLVSSDVKTAFVMTVKLNTGTVSKFVVH